MWIVPQLTTAKWTSEELIDTYPSEVCDGRSEDDCSGNCAWDDGKCGRGLPLRLRSQRWQGPPPSSPTCRMRCARSRLSRPLTCRTCARYAIALERRKAAIEKHNEYIRKFLERALAFEQMMEEHAMLCANDDGCSNDEKCTRRAGMCLLSRERQNLGRVQCGSRA